MYIFFPGQFQAEGSTIVVDLVLALTLICGIKNEQINGAEKL